MTLSVKGRNKTLVISPKIRKGVSWDEIADRTMEFVKKGVRPMEVPAKNQ